MDCQCQRARVPWSRYANHRIDSRQNEVRSGGGITPAACVDQIEGVHGAQTSRQIVEDASRPWAAYVGKLETIQKRGFEK